VTAVGPIEKVYEPSHIRRGRLSTSPTWYVNTLSGERWRFQRKKDAVAFIDSGCACPQHENFCCRYCHGMNVTMRQEMRA
jgi:hypothetical protein